MTVGVITLGAAARQNVRKPDIWPEMIKVDPDQTVFLSLLEGASLGAKISALPPEEAGTTDGGLFRWDEKTQLALTTTVTVAEPTGAALTLTVADSQMMTFGMLLKVDRNGANGDGEIMWVNGSPAAITTVTVQARGMFGTTARPIVQGARLSVIGQATPETAVTVQIRSTVPDPARLQGATQYFRQELASTFRRRATKTWYGYEWPEDAADKVVMLRKLIEKAFLEQGAMDVATTWLAGAGVPTIFTSAGLDGMVTTHRFDNKGNMQYPAFVDCVGAMLRSNPAGGQRWVGLASQRAASHIGLWGMNYYESRTTDDVFGFDALRVKVPTIPQQVIPFYYCPMLDETPMENGFWLLSLAHIKIRYLVEPGKNWNIAAVDTTGRDVTQVGSSDKVAAFEACVGLQVMVQINHGRFVNVAPIMM